MSAGCAFPPATIRALGVRCLYLLRCGVLAGIAAASFIVDPCFLRVVRTSDQTVRLGCQTWLSIVSPGCQTRLSCPGCQTTMLSDLAVCPGCQSRLVDLAVSPGCLTRLSDLAFRKGMVDYIQWYMVYGYGGGVLTFGFLVSYSTMRKWSVMKPWLHCCPPPPLLPTI